jgi:hypothetical protein
VLTSSFFHVMVAYSVLLTTEEDEFKRVSISLYEKVVHFDKALEPTICLSTTTTISPLASSRGMVPYCTSAAWQRGVACLVAAMNTKSVLLHHHYLLLHLFPSNPSPSPRPPADVATGR